MQDYNENPLDHIGFVEAKLPEELSRPMFGTNYSILIKDPSGEIKTLDGKIIKGLRILS